MFIKDPLYFNIEHTNKLIQDSRCEYSGIWRVESGQVWFADDDIVLELEYCQMHHNSREIMTALRPYTITT